MNDFVLLCYSRNSPYEYDAATPVSILALGTYLESKGVAVEYFDERIDPQRRFRGLVSQRPIAVGFSVIGGYQLYSSARLSRIARSISADIPIVWGGICPTTNTEQTLRETFVDYAVIGEGEETLLELVEAIKSGRDPAGLPGIATWSDSKVCKGPPRDPPDVESRAVLYSGKAESMLKRYMKQGTIREAVGYEISRGCPFTCSFCYSPNFHNRTRTKSPAKVDEELFALRKLGVDDIDIYDDTLFGARRRMFPEYLARIRKHDLTWVGNLRINMLDDELLAELESAGCKYLLFGIESDQNDTLSRIRKGVTAEEMRAGVDCVRRGNIPSIFSVIYGLPLEGLKMEVEPYLELACQLYGVGANVEVQVQSYVPLPGSDLYKEAIRMGFQPPKRLLDWVSHDHFGVSNPWLDDPRLGSKLYISSFLAFRYKRHFDHYPVKIVAYPLHRLSLWRIRKRKFGFYFEDVVYRAVLRVAAIWVRFRFFAFNILSWLQRDTCDSHDAPELLPRSSS
jgi:radical SAM superfamily enzyme YgiQ (UPF0313 family)